MKKKILLLLLTICVVLSPLAFAGCAFVDSVKIVSIEKTDSAGLVDTYTVTCSDGSKYTYTVTNGEKGADASALSLSDMYDEYVTRYGQISFEDFLGLYINGNADHSQVVNKCLQSSIKIYTEFAVTSIGLSGFQYVRTNQIEMLCGSGIIYEITNDYVYAITNYHVIYNSNANVDNGSYYARKIHAYLYGSEDSPRDTETMQNGYAVYDYGDYGIEFELVGGSVTCDIALIRAKKEDVFGINENVKAVEFAESYHTGETAIAIGNPESMGISATEGIVSVDNEYISLNIDGTIRQYRSIRIDTSIYGGSSGGGLFNVNGQLIGITNAGMQTDENINYAIPVEIVKAVVENILYYFDDNNFAQAKNIKLGVTVQTYNSRYVYDSSSGYGDIVTDIVVVSADAGSIAEAMGLKTNDKIISFVIGETVYKINQSFEIADALLRVRAGNNIVFNCIRNNENWTSASYQVQNSDLIAVS